MLKRVDRLCLADRVILLGNEYVVRGVYDLGDNLARLSLLDLKDGAEQELHLPHKKEIEVIAQKRGSDGE